MEEASRNPYLLMWPDPDRLLTENAPSAQNESRIETPLRHRIFLKPYRFIGMFSSCI